MVEYGGGIEHGPAGQVGGSGGGSPELGQPVDFFGSVGNVVNDTANWLSAQPLEVLVLGFLAILLAVVLLKRAF